MCVARTHPWINHIQHLREKASYLNTPTCVYRTIFTQCFETHNVKFHNERKSDRETARDQLVFSSPLSPFLFYLSLISIYFVCVEFCLHNCIQSYCCLGQCGLWRGLPLLVTYWSLKLFSALLWAPDLRAVHAVTNRSNLLIMSLYITLFTQKRTRIQSNLALLW